MGYFRPDNTARSHGNRVRWITSVNAGTGIAAPKTTHTALGIRTPWMPPPERHHTAGPAPPRAAPGIGKTPSAGPPVPMERVSSPAIDCSDCCSRGGAAMRTSLRRIAMAAVAVIAVGAATAALPGTAEARWHGGWRGHGGWGWGGFGWGFAPGFAVGFGAPYYGGYYGGPYYAY